MTGTEHTTVATSKKKEVAQEVGQYSRFGMLIVWQIPSMFSQSITNNWRFCRFSETQKQLKANIEKAVLSIKMNPTEILPVIFSPTKQKLQTRFPALSCFFPPVSLPVFLGPLPSITSSKELGQSTINLRATHHLPTNCHIIIVTSRLSSHWLSSDYTWCTPQSETCTGRARTVLT